VNAALPVLAVGMAKAAVGQMLALGVDVRQRPKRRKGDVSGHEFHGNQWTGGGGAGGQSVGTNGIATKAHDDAVRLLDSLPKDREHAIILDSNTGEVIRQESGQPAPDWTTGEVASVPLPIDLVSSGVQIVHIHTHMNEESSFSDGDWGFFASKQVTAMTVVDRDRVYTLKKPDSYVNAERSKYMFRELSEAWNEELATIEGRDIHGDRTAGDMIHDVNKRMAERFGFSYTWKEKGRKSSPRLYTKSSTATRWLEENPEDLDELIDLVSATGLPGFGVLTEMPEQMKSRIASALDRTFSEDYWDNISETTSGNAETILRQGLDEGWSARDMARELRESLGGDEYARTRAMNIARTESGWSLNDARKEVMDGLSEDVGDRLKVTPVWLSVLGSTTRPAHADLDGVPANEDGEWDLDGTMVSAPGDPRLDAGQRCNCQCSVSVEFGMEDDAARQLISDYYSRQEENETSIGVYRRKFGARGDVPGHEFHGNQWTGLGGGGSEEGLPKGVMDTEENREIKWTKSGKYYVNAESLILYHGTTESRAVVIEKEGLRYGNLTSKRGYAAEIAKIRREGEAPVVFEVKVPPGHIYPVWHGPKTVATDALSLAASILASGLKRLGENE
jgi:hypothetical protein